MASVPRVGYQGKRPWLYCDAIYLDIFKVFLKEYIFKHMFFNYSSLRETAGDILYAVCLDKKLHV